MTGPDPQPPAAETVTVQVNGEARPLPQGLRLDAALRELGHEPRLVVVEVNGEILPRSAWPQHEVQESDVLEVVTIVGGGS
ncbi:MAG: sulfur carrier protein ThiS [Synechococcaceae cyanobacterium]|nr:sulfur carrier protein ThiS [Synechococcaceae cyanobacterium]